MEELENKDGVAEVDKTFDKAERIWDRFQKLLLKIVGGVVGISLAIYVAYDQVKDKHKETVGTTVEQSASDIGESAPKHKKDYIITKKTFIVDDYNHRKGDTVYVDYYDDGFIDKYYATDGKTYYKDE